MSVSFGSFEYTDVSGGSADMVRVTIHFPDAPNETVDVQETGTTGKFTHEFTGAEDVTKLTFQPFDGPATYGNSVAEKASSGFYLTSVTGWNDGTGQLPDNKATKQQDPP